jgi:hypothetical protein
MRHEQRHLTIVETLPFIRRSRDRSGSFGRLVGIAGTIWSSLPSLAHPVTASLRLDNERASRLKVGSQSKRLLFVNGRPLAAFYGVSPEEFDHLTDFGLCLSERAKHCSAKQET